VLLQSDRNYVVDPHPQWGNQECRKEEEDGIPVVETLQLGASQHFDSHRSVVWCLSKSPTHIPALACAEFHQRIRVQPRQFVHFRISGRRIGGGGVSNGLRNSGRRIGSGGGSLSHCPCRISFVVIVAQFRRICPGKAPVIPSAASDSGVQSYALLGRQSAAQRGAKGRITYAPACLLLRRQLAGELTHTWASKEVHRRRNWVGCAQRRSQDRSDGQRRTC